MTAHAIRQIGLPDRDLLRSAVEVFADVGADALVAEWITGFVANSQSFAFVALGTTDEVLGWAWGAILRRPDGPPEARVEAVDVLATGRRGGVGAMLFDAVYSHAQRTRCGAIVADVPFDLADPAQGFIDSLRPTISDAKRVRWSM